jgi:hypothetical protein
VFHAACDLRFCLAQWDPKDFPVDVWLVSHARAVEAVRLDSNTRLLSHAGVCVQCGLLRLSACTYLLSHAWCCAMPVRCSSGLLGSRCRRVDSSAVLQRTVTLFRFVSTCSECKSRENPEPPAQSTRAVQASPHSHTHASAGRRTMTYIMKQHLFLHIVKSTQRCTAFVVLLFLCVAFAFQEPLWPSTQCCAAFAVQPTSCAFVVAFVFRVPPSHTTS